MNMKKNWKRFWTLNRHHAEGFTLVELIVVIAIMGILVGVGVPVYGGYVERTNMGVDQALVSEMKNAAILGVMDNYSHEIAGEVVVKLSATKSAEVAGAEADMALVNTIMEEAFGADWKNTCMLKFDGWTVKASDVVTSYRESSLNGKEQELLGTTSQMTNNLANWLNKPSRRPAAITDTMEEYGYTNLDDNTTFANAAVLTLAKDFSANGDAIKAAFAAGNVEGIGSGLANVCGSMYEDPSMQNLARAALMYTYATTFTEYVSKQNPEDTTAKNIMTQLNTALASSETQEMKSGQVAELVNKYFGQLYMNYSGGMIDEYIAADGKGNDDVDAIIAMMGGVTESADTLAENLSSSTCYADASGLVASYLAVGSVLKDGYTGGVIIRADGVVNGYLGGLN